MANFRSTADYVDSILQLAGEVTNGNSPYEAKALEHLNAIHKTIIMGGNEFNIDVDEQWPWAMSKRPLYLELVPAIEGTVAITKGSESITFSAAPTDEDSANVSLVDWFITFDGNSTVYRVASHTSGATSAELNSNVISATAAATTFKAYKLIYKLQPDLITIQDGVNDYITFSETTAKTLLACFLTEGTYTPSELATEIATQMTAAGASTYTANYLPARKRFAIDSNLSGGDNVFYLIGENTANTLNIRARSAHATLGFGLRDIEGDAAGTIYSDDILGGIAKLANPLKLHTQEKGYEHSEYATITQLDLVSFDAKYPPSVSTERNPTYFKILDHTHEGELTIQLNHYPSARRLLEIDYVPMPLDLYDNVNSSPLLPKIYSKVLEYGAAAWLLLEKEDSKAQQYFQMAGQKLQAMMASNRKTDERLGRHFGEVVAREDLLPYVRRRLRYGYTEN